MSRAGRLVMVKVVLSSIPVYLMLAIDLPKSIINAIDKRRVFFWKGQKHANEGNCLVSWELGHCSVAYTVRWSGHPQRGAVWLGLVHPLAVVAKE